MPTNTRNARSDVEFLNAIRDVLGLCPLPYSAAAGKETLDFYEHQSSRNIGWATGETDGNRRVRRVGSETRSNSV